MELGFKSVASDMIIHSQLGVGARIDQCGEVSCPGNLNVSSAGEEGAIVRQELWA